MGTERRFQEMLENGIGKNTTSGDPVITRKEIKQSKNQLDILLRKLIVDNRITKEIYDRQFHLYSQSTEGIHPAAIANRKGNLLKAIKIGGISFKKLIEFTCGVLNYKLVNVELTFKKLDNVVYKVKLREDI